MKLRLFLVLFVCIIIKQCEPKPQGDIPIRVLGGLTNVVRVLMQGMKSLQGIILDAIMNQAHNSLSSVETSASSLLNTTESLLSRLMDVGTTARNIPIDGNETNAQNDSSLFNGIITTKLNTTTNLINTTIVLLRNLHNSTADLILSRVEVVGNLLNITTPLITSIATRTMNAVDNGVHSFNGLIEAKLDAVTVLLNESVFSLLNTVANGAESLSRSKIAAAHTILNASSLVVNTMNNSTHEWIDFNADLLTDIVDSTLGVLNTVSSRTHHMNGVRKNLTRIMDNISEHRTADATEQSVQEIQKLLTLFGSSLESTAAKDTNEEVALNLNRATTSV